MLYQFFELVTQLDTIFWGYIGFSLIILLGVYFTFKTKFYQLRALPSIIQTFVHFLQKRTCNSPGTHPLKVFFASVGGMVGIGNVVGITTAIQLGGPGALFWVWIAGFAGSLIKYSEIFLGLKHRVVNDRGGYDGGPMYFLKKAYKGRWISYIICIFLCIYGVEIYQFGVITDSLADNWEINRYAVIAVMLGLILYAASGGVPRVAKICVWIMPAFIISYIAMSVWVIAHYFTDLPQIFLMVFKAAFTGHAAVGGFAGSSVILAIQNGMAGACYSSDIGIGYDSIIQSESRTTQPEKQARVAIFGVFLDNFICTMSILLVLVTGLWSSDLEGSFLVQKALEPYFPYMNIIMPLFLFILGYTTLISYFSVGVKCARFLHPKRGERLFFCYAAAALLFFSFFDQTEALFVMRFAGATLLIINLIGIFRLRKEISFIKEKDTLESPSEAKVNAIA